MGSFAQWREIPASIRPARSVARHVDRRDTPRCRRRMGFSTRNLLKDIIMARHQGSCHCNTVQFELDADITYGVQCDCSICKRKNAIMLRLPADKFRLIRGEEALSLYQWNTRAAKHYFCKHCGIYTHHQPRTRADMVGVNLGCIDDVDAGKLPVERLEGSKLSGSRL